MFREDLIDGIGVEVSFVEEMKKRYRNVYRMEGNFPWYDIVLVKDDGDISTIEIKHDRKWKETGNVAIEMEYRGNGGGILHSKADYVVYFLDGEWWVCGRDKLIIWILDADVSMVYGGDGGNSYLALVPVDSFKKLFTRLFQESAASSS